MPLIILIVLALTFDFLNGLHDSSNIVATVISSQAMKPRSALILTAVGEFLGPFLFGVAVAKAVGEGLLVPEVITLQVMGAALAGAIVWNLATLYFGIPSSSSHALIGGLVGAAISAGGLAVVKPYGLGKILAALFISPPLGLLAGFVVTKIVFFLARSATPKINSGFRRMQVFTSFGLALSHGANDAQKTMGVITLALFASGEINNFEVPMWVIFASAIAISLGTSFGGWRLIRTLGGRIIKVRPVHGFASQIAGASVILGAALLGGPVSTTQVMSSSIMGTGAAERINKVRWQVGKDMLTAWLMTIPISGSIAALCYFVIIYFS
ncbi:MAG: inorganic phosphate transporter [Anaerolineae bacterium]|nr:inorganic phosphate transporter [Anaerolineae bacterium]